MNGIVLLCLKHWNNLFFDENLNNIKGVGHGRGIMARGRAVGLRGNISRPAGVLQDQRGVTAAVQAATVVARGAGQARPSARGIQRGKPLQNIPGESERDEYKKTHTKRRTVCILLPYIHRLGSSTAFDLLPNENKN